MKDTKFMKAKEKELTVKQFKRFVKSLIEDRGKVFVDKYNNELDLTFTYFTKRVYEHLHLHFGFIAHYDRLGFYGTYFNGDVKDLKTFLSHFIDLETKEIKPYFYTDEYADINTAFSEVLQEKICDLLPIFNKETTDKDVLMIKTLMFKHNIKKMVV